MFLSLPRHFLCCLELAGQGQQPSGPSPLGWNSSASLMSELGSALAHLHTLLCLSLPTPSGSPSSPFSFEMALYPSLLPAVWVQGPCLTQQWPGSSLPPPHPLRRRGVCLPVALLHLVMAPAAWQCCLSLSRGASPASDPLVHGPGFFILLPSLGKWA